MPASHDGWSSLQLNDEDHVPAVKPDDYSRWSLGSTANVALPLSGTSSLRQLQHHYGDVGRMNGAVAVEATSILDVTLPPSESSSLRQLQSSASHTNLPNGTASAKSSLSALKMPLPGSGSSSMQALVEQDATSMTFGTNAIQDWTVPLPESRRSSVASASTADGLDPPLTNSIQISSLEQLQNADVPPQSADHVQPGNHPLPPSASSLQISQIGENEGQWNFWGFSKENRKKAAKKKKKRHTTDLTTYAERIRPLIRCMPHLACLEWTDRECRNLDSGAISLVDFHGALNKAKVTSLKEANVDWAHGPSILRKGLRKTSKDVSSRLVIVEDLSPSLIESLGSYFNIDPEAFALQLSRARPSKDFPVDDHDGEWNTLGMPKSSASIQWYRPVRLGGSVAQWLKDPTSLRRLLGVSTSGEEEDTYLSWDQKQVKHWKRDQYGITGTSRFVSQKDIHHMARISTNIFRRSWLLSTKTAEASDNSVPTAWEERATIFKYEHASVPTVLLLVDPMPGITDSQRVTETRLRLNPVPTKVTREPTEEMHEVEIFLPSRIRVPIKLPSNKMNVSEDEMEELRKASEATSTSTAVVSWLSALHDQTNPVLALLEVVRLDSIAFFDSLDICLKEISEDSMDDYLMTRRLADWRQLLNDFESKVTETGQSLHDFVDFAFDDPMARPVRVEEVIEELDSRTQRFAQRIEKAYAALRAEMGLFESRRSIAEAETVTKLTELAFLFIPLTFCCGLFSMQVNELQDGVPLTTFVITAVIVFVICYGARIVMRSSIIVESMQSAQENLWVAGKMKPGSRIPTRQLIWLTLKEAWKRGGSAVTYLVFLSVLSFTVIPVAFLWAKVRLDASLNAMVTLFLVPIGIALAWACATAYTEVRSQDNDKVPLALRLALWVSEVIFSRRASDSRFSSTFSSPEDSEYDDV